MTPKDLSLAWAAIAPALANHLWQSTAFALAAGLLTLTLRKNHARARYWIWLAASMKFLVPFSLLVALGGRLATPSSPAGMPSGLYSALAEASQPFAHPANAVASSVAAVTDPVSSIHLLPVLLVVGWLCGFAAVLCLWSARWR